MATLSRFAVFWKVFFAALIGGTAVTAASQDETDAWTTAVSANTTEGYYLYLSLYPAGEYVDEAIAAIGQLGTAGAPRQIGQPADAGPGQGSTGAGVY